MSRHTRLALWSLLAVALVGSIAAAGATGGRGQAATQEPQPPLPELKPAISLLFVNEPFVTVTYDGVYGRMRVSGTLVGAPEATLKVTGADGEAREVRWAEVSSLQIVRVPTAELPVGSFTIMLSSDEGVLPRSSPISFGTAYTPGAVASDVGLTAPPRRVTTLQGGDLVLQGSPYGTLRIPISRITGLAMVPIRGSLLNRPEGNVVVDIGNGEGEEGKPAQKTVPLPLPRIATLRRDVPRGLIAVTLQDGQVFTGRLVSLPEATLEIEIDAMTKPTYPLARVAQMEVTTPLVGTPGAGAPGP